MELTYIPCPKCRKLNRVQLGQASGPVCGSCKVELPLHGAVTEPAPGTFKVLLDKSPLPVVVDFWAPWCGPCRSFAPVFEQAALRLAGKFVMAKLNTEQDAAIAAQFGIRSIPTLALFMGGREVNRMSGALPLTALLDWIQANAPRSAA